MNHFVWFGTAVHLVLRFQRVACELTGVWVDLGHIRLVCRVSENTAIDFIALDCNQQTAVRTRERIEPILQYYHVA